MKDFEVPNPSTRISSGASNTNVDDDYNFTDDQRKAAQELQTLYRKLGLEELDDGYEEGFSAYDDPQYDIVGKLQEVNNRFNEDSTPIDSNRLRKVRFKESVVDLVVPISPNRSYFDKYQYLDQDDEEYGDYEVYVDENQNEVDKIYPEDGDYGDIENNHTDYDYQSYEKPEMDNEPDKEEDPEQEEEIERNSVAEESIDSSKTERSEIGLEHEEQYQFVDETEDNRKDVVNPETCEDELEKEGTKETDNDPEHQKSPQKEVEKLQTDITPSKSDTLAKPRVLPNRPRSSVPQVTQPLATAKKVQRPASSISHGSKNIATGSTRPTKPEKCLPTYKGNTRSKYGVPDELKRELRKLKQLETIQKKLKEHEQNDYRRRKREEAELAFKAWLENKKTLNYDKQKSEGGTGSTKKHQVQSNEETSERAFQSWLEQKENQQRKEKFLQQLKEIDESETGLTSKSRREQSKRAYRKWLRKKNSQRRQQMSLESPLGIHFSNSRNLAYSLPRALQQADTLKQTFQAYFGKMTW